jgi:hypothetical protein
MREGGEAEGENFGGGVGEGTAKRLLFINAILQIP